MQNKQNLVIILSKPDFKLKIKRFTSKRQAMLFFHDYLRNCEQKLPLISLTESKTKSNLENTTAKFKTKSGQLAVIYTQLNFISPKLHVVLVHYSTDKTFLSFYPDEKSMMQYYKLICKHCLNEHGKAHCDVINANTKTNTKNYQFTFTLTKYQPHISVTIANYYF